MMFKNHKEDKAPERTVADIKLDIDAIVQAQLDIVLDPDFERTAMFNPMLLKQKLQPLIKQYKELKRELRCKQQRKHK